MSDTFSCVTAIPKKTNVLHHTGLEMCALRFMQLNHYLLKLNNHIKPYRENPLIIDH